MIVVTRFPSDEQLEPIRWDRGNACVIAIPGSGKTAVLVEKVVRLLNSGLRVTAVTFTRSAAEELRRRVVLRVPVDLASQFDCGTFHSLVLYALRAIPDSPLRNRRIADKQEVEGLMREALELAGLSITKRTLQKLDLTRARTSDPYGIEEARGLSTGSGPAETMLTDALALQVAARNYDRLTTEAGLVDLSQIVQMGLERVIGGLDILEADYLLVDEAQDVDEVQLSMLIIWAKRGTRTMLVGDDDQSVYGFREGLGFEGLQTFLQATGAEGFRLSENFRCRKEILDAAAQVIEENDERMSKRLFASKGAGGSIRLVSFEDNFAEAKGVATWVMALAQKNAGKIAVIARTNWFLDVIEDQLKGHLEYHRALDEDFWDSPVPGTIISFLRCLAEPHREVAGFGQVLRLWGLRSSDIQPLKTCSPDGTLRGIVQSEMPLDRDVPTLVALAVNSLRSICRLAGYPVALVSDSAIDRMLAQVDERFQVSYEVLAQERGEKEDRIESTLRAVGAAFRALSKFSGPLGRRLTAVKMRSAPQEDSSVQLATMHASKGLEFEHVFVIGCEQGTIPREGVSGAEKAEERRLIYVALTRAKEHLVITYPQKVLRNNRVRSAWCTDLLAPVVGLKAVRWEDLEEPWNEQAPSRPRQWWSKS